MPRPISRTCQTCCAHFEVTAEERRFLEEIATRTWRTFRLPANCTPCRAQRRHAAITVTVDADRVGTRNNTN